MLPIFKWNLTNEELDLASLILIAYQPIKGYFMPRV